MTDAAGQIGRRDVPARTAARRTTPSGNRAPDTTGATRRNKDEQTSPGTIHEQAIHRNAKTFAAAKNEAAQPVNPLEEKIIDFERRANKIFEKHKNISHRPNSDEMDEVCRDINRMINKINSFMDQNPSMPNQYKERLEKLRNDLIDKLIVKKAD